MLQYKWIINKLIAISEEDNLTDVVKHIHWTRELTDGNKTIFSNGIERLDKASGENFVNYSELTYQQVCGWLSRAEVSVDANLLERFNYVPPTSVIRELELPFQNE